MSVTTFFRSCGIGSERIENLRPQRSGQRLSRPLAGAALRNDVEQVDRTFDAVRRAVQNMTPVKVGAGRGREDRITVNRTLRLKTAKTGLSATPIPARRTKRSRVLGRLILKIGILQSRPNGWAATGGGLQLRLSSPFRRSARSDFSQFPGLCLQGHRREPGPWHYGAVLAGSRGD